MHNRSGRRRHRRNQGRDRAAQGRDFRRGGILLAEVVGWLVLITAIDEAKLVRVAKDRSSIDPPEYLEVFERLRQLDTIGHTGKLWERWLQMSMKRWWPSNYCRPRGPRQRNREPNIAHRRPQSRKTAVTPTVAEKSQAANKMEAARDRERKEASDGWVGGEKLWLDYEAKHKKVAIKAAAVSLTPALQGSIGNDDEDLERLKAKRMSLRQQWQSNEVTMNQARWKNPLRGPRIRKSYLSAVATT